MRFLASDLICLPGVPVEYKGLCEVSVLPRIAERAGEVPAARLVKLIGIPESHADEAMRPVMDAPEHRGVRFGYRAHWPEIHVKWSVSGPDAEAHAERILGEVRRIFGDAVFAEGKEELVELPGVGRKTANVVLGNAMGIEAGVIVDTHVTRLSGRLGFSKHADPVDIEQDLMKIVPRSEWTKFANHLILHGRRVCIARKPACPSCVLNDICPSADIFREDPASPAKSKARSARSARPSSKPPSRTRTSGSPRARTPSR